MVQQHGNLIALLDNSARRFGQRPLFGTRKGGSWTWTTYAQFARDVDDLRGGLAALGIGPGDRVAIVANNRVEWAVAAYATFGLGASFVPMYETQRVEDWRFILGDCGAKIVLGSSANVVRSLEGLRPELPALADVIAIERSAEAPASYGRLLATGRESPVAAVQPSGSSVAAFIYTSGTTGKPKGVLLSHGNLTSNIAATMEVFPIAPEDRSLSFLPWAHAYGQVTELHMMLSVGASTALNDDVKNLIANLAEVQPTLLVAVPRIFNKLYQSVNEQMAEKPAAVRALFRRGIRASIRERRGERLSALDRAMLELADRLAFAKIRAKLGGRLKYVISASAALGEDVARFVDALGIEVYEGYGLTETSPVVSANRPGARKLGSVGQTIPGVRVVIDERASTEPGRGEIVVYGPNVMLGYHHRPDETARAIQPDGGFRTGDLGYLDADGYLYITGRIKEQYKLENGKYVMPSPLEEQLKLSPYFANVFLHGANKPFNVALVALDQTTIKQWAKRTGISIDGNLLRDPAVHELVRGELERWGASFRGYEKPRAFALTLEDFTTDNGMLTPTLKLKRAEVLRRHEAELESLYGESARLGSAAV